MTWPSLGGATQSQSCYDAQFHRLGANAKFINEKDRIFVRACRRCPFVYIGQIKLVENDQLIKAQVIQLNENEWFTDIGSVDDAQPGQNDAGSTNANEYDERVMNGSNWL